MTVNRIDDIEKLPAGASVELKVDTGMHRNGIEPERFAEALERIAARGLDLAGVMTHYRSADEMGSDFFWQKKRFERIREEALRLGVAGVRWHGYKTVVSSYDIGYGDGWLRRPYTLPCGKRIVGRVSMDSISVEGDDESICIFDDAAVAAKQLGTISYEVTTRLSPYIERVVV